MYWNFGRLIWSLKLVNVSSGVGASLSLSSSLTSFYSHSVSQHTFASFLPLILIVKGAVNPAVNMRLPRHIHMYVLCLQCVRRFCQRMCCFSQYGEFFQRKYNDPGLHFNVM